MRAAEIRKNAARLYVGISLAVYIVLNSILLYFHEPWCDEAQAWLIARELSPLGIIKQMAYEGHPAMWHFLLAPFAKSGMPYASMGVLSLTFMTIAAWVLLKYAPFHRIIRVCLILSPLFMYYFPVIARSYCLVALIIVLLAACYKKRSKISYYYCLLIALLIQTHIIMLAMAGFLSIFFLVERWKEGRTNRKVLKSILPLFLPFLSFILLLLQISGVKKSSAMPENVDFRSFFMLGGLIPTLIDRQGVAVCIFLGALLAGLFFFFTYLAVRMKIGKEFCVFVLSLLFQAFIYTSVYGINRQRAFCALFIVAWFVWVCYEPIIQFMSDRNRKGMLHGQFLINGMVVGGVVILVFLYTGEIVADLTGSYSYAKDMAKAIETYVPLGADIVTSENGRTASIVPYLDNYKFYSYQNGDYTTYAIWDSRLTQEYTVDEMIRKVSVEEKGDGFYLLIPPSSCIPDLEDKVSEWKLLYKTPEDCIKDEYYSLYYVAF